MELDRTHVVIRPRSISEICDLSLLVMRHYFVPFWIAFITGALPWVLLDVAVLAPQVYDYEFEGIVDEETVGNRIWYFWIHGSMVFIQAQIAGVVATSYIGQAVFESRPSVRQVASSVFRIASRWIWVLGIVRGPLLLVGVFICCWLFDWSMAAMSGWISVLLVYVGILRSIRPHVPEIVILEQPPLRAPKQGQLTLRRRSSYFHSMVAGDCFSRCLAMTVLAVVLTGSLFMSLLFVQGVFYRNWSMGMIAQIVYLPLAMWIVSGYMTIVRFLCYLDFRIRLEGWDVDLGLRAERERLLARLRPIAPTTMTTPAPATTIPTSSTTTGAST